MVRWLTAGESHGPALVTIAEGLPAGIAVASAEIGDDLARRRLGAGRGARMKFERDEVRILGGVRHGRTLGGPVAIEVGNTEWPKWEQVMSPDPVDEVAIAALARNAPLTRPRPGHADLVGMQKYGFTDARPILERASARETAARVALGGRGAGLPARRSAGIEVAQPRRPHRRRAVGAGRRRARPGRPRRDRRRARCAASTAAAAAAMEAEIAAAHRDGDTLGGVVEVLAYGLPPGLGSHVHWDRRLDARLAAALMGIQAIKGVEVGDGFGLAAVRGSQAQDEIVAGESGLERTSGKSGGTEGGMSTGEVLRVRAAMKPISTIPKALRTVDVATGEAAPAINQRSDVCAVPGRRRGGRGDGAHGAGRRRCWRSSAATASPRSRATCGATSTTCPSADGRRPRARRLARARASRRVGRRVAERLRRPVRRHRRADRGRGRHERLRHLRRPTARTSSARSRPTRSRGRSRSATGVLSLGGGAVLRAGDAGAAGRTCASCGCAVSAADAAQPGRA